MLVVTLVWAPHWPFYRFGLAPPPYGIIDTVFAPADLLLMGIVAGWSLALVSGQDRIALSPRWITTPLLVFVLASWLAIFVALNQTAALRFAIRSTGLAVLYLYVHRSVEARRIGPAALAMWLVPGLAFNGLLAIAQAVHQNPLGLAWLGEPQTLRATAPTPVVLVHGTRLLRAFGLLPHPNALGGLLAAALPLVAGLLLWPEGVDRTARVRPVRQGGAIRDALLLLSAAVMVAGIVLSFSRSAWLGLLCGGLYLIVRRVVGYRTATLGPYTKRGIVLVASIGLVIAALLAAEWNVVSVRLQPTSNRLERTSIQQRLSLLDLSFKIISWRPTTGVGGDNFALAAERFLPPNRSAQSSDVPVHNTYLLAQAELGPLGGISWLALMLTPLLGLARQRPKRRFAGALRATSAPGAMPSAMKEGIGQMTTAVMPWTRMAATARGRVSIETGHTVRDDVRGPAPRGMSAGTQWQGLAGCSLIVVAVIGLVDWYMWGNGPGNEPVAVLWIIALTMLTTPAGELHVMRRREHRRVYPIVVLVLLAVMAAAVGTAEYLSSDRALPKIIVRTVNMNVGGQTQDAITLRLRPFSLKQRFRVVALIVAGRPPILVSAYKLGYRIDNGLTAWRAYQVGHTGPLQHRLLQLAQTLGSGVTVRIAQRVDEIALRAYLFKLQGAVNSLPQPGVAGRTLDVVLAQRHITYLLLHRVGAFQVHLSFVPRSSLPLPRTPSNRNKRASHAPTTAVRHR